MKYIKSITFISFLIVCLSISAIGQEDIEIKKSDFRIEAKETGFDEAWDDVKNGEKLYSQGLGKLPEALQFYLRAVKYNPNCASLNYKIGVCYLASDKFSNSTDYLLKAFSKNELITRDINLLIGRAYHLNLDFDKAIEHYKAYYALFSEKNIDEIKVNVDKLIKECKFGREIVNKPVRVIINNLGDRINSSYDDYNPVLHPNHNQLFFTSRRPLDKNDKVYEEDNKYFENIFVSEQAGELWKIATHVEDRIDSKNNESILGFSYDGNQMFIYNGKEGGGEILVSELKEGGWKSPDNVRGDISSKYAETTMSISKDGKEMFIVSDRPESTVGGMDIYYCVLNEKNKWSQPSNLGPKVNSPFDEEGVFLSPKGDKLYFSSKGHNSMGGFDIFVTERDKDGTWGDPVNLGYPINSAKDDIFFKIEENEKQAYYSSVRENGIGGLDIYKIIFLGEEKELKIGSANENLAWNFKPDYTIFYNKPSELKIDTSLYMVGIITNSKSGEPVMAKIEVIDMEQSKIIATGLSDSLGNYKVKINQHKDYGVEITAKDYLFYVKMANLKDKQVVESKIQANFQLDKVEVGAKVILNNIFFETNKATLKSESYAELERVLRLLTDNITIRLEISGHTDNVGGFQANLKLSESRAKSVVEYLIGRGIEKSRLEYKGYSFNQPVADNATPDGRAQNRRVEFKVLSK
jgi:outer membrane protein OmpA-like peptidoglycan-associated protein/tetratricopeptide (TPR) repeat protein